MRQLAFVGFFAVACASPQRVGEIDLPRGGGSMAVTATPGVAHREQTADQQVMHALTRLAFGAKPGDVERVRRMGVDAWIEQQLRPERMDDSPLEHFLAANYQTLTQRPGELEQRYPPPGQLRNQLLGRNGDRGTMSRADSARLRESQQAQRLITTEVQSARVARALLTERQTLEVLTDFWLNHFSVFQGKGPRERYMIAEYENRVIRPNALGRFRTLLGNVAKSEAMLFYLDNWQSQADSGRPRLAQIPQARRRGSIGRGRGGQPPQQMQQVAQRLRAGLNENYGRELLELHTLGVDGGYTQDDVINAARALTGWTITGPQQGGRFQFQPLMHDAGEKVVLGHKLAVRRGIEDGEDLLDIVARHPATARHIAFKLARRFVSDSPSTALVERASATFTRTDGDIRETLRTIITSDEFFSGAAWRSKVKSPFEVVASTARALGAQPDPTPRMAGLVEFLGQPIYGHQAPNGWPETGDQWMNTGSILNRINFGVAMASGRLPGISPFGFGNAGMLRDEPRDRQVDGVISALLGGDASPETRAVLISGLNPLAKGDAAAMIDPKADDSTMPPGGRGGRAGDAAARGGGRAGLGGRGLGQAPQLSGLSLIVGLALGSPEFQRR